VQTRPGNEPEPEREPEETGEPAESPASSESADERDPFTPKVRPGDDAGEPEEAAAEGEVAEPGALAETVDMRKHLPEEPEGAGAGAEEVGAAEPKQRGGADDAAASEPEKRGDALAETVDLRDMVPEDAEPEEREARDRAETVDMRGPQQEGAEPDDRGGRDEAEPVEPGKHGDALAETVDMRGTLPNDPAADAAGESANSSGEAAEPAKEEPAPRRRSGDQAAEGDALRRRSSDQPADGEEPAPRRRSGDQPVEGEPGPRRRSGPGGQPQRPVRRPEPGQDPRRVPARPHGNHGSSEPGPKRRPPSEHAPDHAAKRRPGPESHPAAAYVAAAASAPPGKGGLKPPAKPPGDQGRRNLAGALWPPRFSRNQAVVGVLLAVLGAALAIQVRATNTSDQILRGARNDDLVNILDEVTSRGQSLDAELRNLETQNAAIQDSADKAQAALAQAQQKARDLQILAGTVKAKGSGITMTITDPQGQIKSATLLNALEELRAAGAEVIQIDDVRVVVSSSLVDTADGGVALDGHELAMPYVYKVIGDPNTLGPAMQIPGGVVATVKSSPGANVTITPGQVLVDAVAPQPNPQYAKAG
jgi:uncharacterized protein YlxW (UPF0749 family)